jgi:hypothetical protein
MGNTSYDILVAEVERLTGRTWTEILVSTYAATVARHPELAGSEVTDSCARELLERVYAYERMRARVREPFASQLMTPRAWAH